MNRRDFFGCALAGITAALALRLQPFIDWWTRMFGERRRELFEGINRKDIRSDITRFAESMKVMYPRKAFEPEVLLLSPGAYRQMQEMFA